MSRIGRPPKSIPTVDWKLHMPVDLAAEVDLLCTDPVTGKLRYGARTELVELALRIHLERLRSIPKEPTDNVLVGSGS